MILSGFKRFSPERKRIIVIAASMSLCALLIGGYILLSVNTWRNYETSFESWRSDLKVDIDKSLAMPVATTDERAKKKTALKEISDEISSAQQSLCTVPVIISWQLKISSFGRDAAACAAMMDDAVAFGKKVQQTTNYLDYEQMLTKALVTAISSSSKKVTEATWSGQTVIWQDAEKAITKIPASQASFQPVRTAAIDKVKAIQSAWSELIAAHSAKDKAKYTEAQAKLATAYEALPSLANTSKQQFTVISESLQGAYAELFRPKV